MKLIQYYEFISKFTRSFRKHFSCHDMRNGTNYTPCKDIIQKAISGCWWFADMSKCCYSFKLTTTTYAVITDDAVRLLNYTRLHPLILKEWVST